MRKAFEKDGFKCFTPNLKPFDARYGIPDLGNKLKNQIERELGQNTKFALVGFSMGGIIARYYLQELNGINRVNPFITISTPHHGSYLAYFYPSEGIRQLRPKSDFLAKLESNESVMKNVDIYSYRTPFDLTIVPSTSSFWRMAENKKYYSLLHPLMVFDRRLTKDTVQVLLRYS